MKFSPCVQAVNDSLLWSVSEATKESNQCQSKGRTRTVFFAISMCPLTHYLFSNALPPVTKSAEPE